MPLQATSGAASQDAFGGNGVAVVPAYIEEVFSTYLYTGNGTSQTITNNIDVSTKGGLVWLKSRSGAQYHGLWDTLRGPTHALNSGLTNAQYTTTSTQDLTGFTSSGFTVGTYWNNSSNQSDATYVSWTFRKQPKFFDVVTWTGDGANRTIAHALGSVPACIMVKRTDTTGAWQVYHRSLANTEYLVLNTTAAKATGATRWNSTTPTSTVFSLGTDATVNASGGTYVAYIFAHDAGGFGLSGSDNVISCGAYTGNGSASGIDVSLGYEPQWVLQKRADSTSNWLLQDIMRGMPLSGNTALLLPNQSVSEYDNIGLYMAPTATGFKVLNNDPDVNASGGTYIYIAIRRGPMKVPTTGTIARTGTGATTTVTGVGFAPDLVISKDRTVAVAPTMWDRLRGSLRYLSSSSLLAEASDVDGLIGFDSMDGIRLGADTNVARINNSGRTFINYFFKRAVGVLDEVCDIGTGASHTISHNLNAVPELMIRKRRDDNAQFEIYSAGIANTEKLVLNSTAAKATDTTAWDSTTPTSTVFTVGTGANVNTSAATYVTYLFATSAGVSKVGSYTGTATTKQIDCGFTAGARFVLIKRTDSTGDWYVWDTTRGIVSGNDPYFLLNSTAAEVTSTDYIDTYSAGFEISSTAPAAINASGGSFIFLAIS